MPASLLPYVSATCLSPRSAAAAAVPMLAMSTLMMPAPTMTTMTNPGPIPVAQAKFEANGKLPLAHAPATNKAGKTI